MAKFYLQYYVRKIAKKIHQDEDGAALIEYALLVALIALVCVAAITTVGEQIRSVFESIAEKLGYVAPA